jgi:calcineurin-like phosphoesterase family protein
MSKRLLISDMHFGHEAIMRYENRPFESVDEMDAEIIQRWNVQVKKADHIFVLGDISFHSPEKTKEIFKKLNGNKTLILGNHDNRSVSFYLSLGFKFVSKYPIIVDEFYILSHAPVYLNENMPYVNIHGHIHNKTISGKYYNVSVERTNYSPINFDFIKRTFK